ncbi:hypothetical protein D3C74_306520 [compost metagenome]
MAAASIHHHSWQRTNPTGLPHGMLRRLRQCGPAYVLPQWSPQFGGTYKLPVRRCKHIPAFPACAPVPLKARASDLKRPKWTGDMHQGSGYAQNYAPSMCHNHTLRRFRQSADKDQRQSPPPPSREPPPSPHFPCVHPASIPPKMRANR